MGSGLWTTCDYVTHSTTTRGFSSMDAFYNASAQELYRSKKMNDLLNPYKVVRECRDSEEHPNTIPVILALDVTGSMGPAAEAVAKQLGDIMDNLYGKITDVEFMIMAIGDLSYDDAPIQASQFESDIRIAEQLEKVFFEKGGGGNHWESYTAPWYFGVHNTDLDCWKRGKKGIIITMGDEPMNPYLPCRALNSSLGCSEQSDVDTKELYQEVCKKFDVFHIAVKDECNSYWRFEEDIKNSFGKLLGQNFMVATCEELKDVIPDIIISSQNISANESFVQPIGVVSDVDENSGKYKEVSW